MTLRRRAGGLIAGVACLLAVVGLTAAVAAAPDLRSDFDSTIEGWTHLVVSGSSGQVTSAPVGEAPSHVRGGGASGSSTDNFARIRDLGDDGWSYWGAPAAYLGDRGAYVGGSLSFSLRSDQVMKPGFTTRFPPAGDDVELVGANGVRIFHDVPSEDRAANVWHRSTVPLRSTAFKHFATSGAVTEAEFAAVLADLEAIRIRAEFSTERHIDDLDAVHLSPPAATATPTPTPTASATATATPTPNASELAALGEPTTDPPLDGDGDGLGPEGDRCRATPKGQAVLVSGCSLPEVVREPGLMAAPALNRLRKGLSGLTADGLRRRFLGKPARRLARSRASLLRVSGEIGRLDFCGAATAARKARSKVLKGSAGVRDGLRRAGRFLLVRGHEGRGVRADADSSTLEHSFLDLKARDLASVVRASKALAGLTRRLCREAEVTTAEGTIADLDPSGLATLDGGAKVALVGLEDPVGLELGRTLKATGPIVGGLVFAKEVNPQPNPEVFGDHLCLRPRIAPYAFGTYAPEVLRLDGFLSAPGVLLLERDTGFGAVGTLGCKASSPIGEPYRYTLQVVIAVKKPNGVTEKEAPVYLEPGERALDLVLDTPANSEQTVTFTEFRATCRPYMVTPDCKEPVQITEPTTYVIEAAGGPLGTVNLAEQTFEVPDRQAAEAFATTTITSAGSSVLPNPQPAALAFAHSGGASSFPDLEPVGLGSTIAVHADSHPEALQFPQIFGLRNGSPYLYSASSDKVTTDRIAACGNKEAFYTTPWRKKAFRVTQGSFHKGWTHEGAWAWDFGMPKGTPLYAARGGKVLELEQSYEKSHLEIAQDEYGKEYTSLSESEQAEVRALAANNYLIIEHQDGTVSKYLHIQKGSAKVAVGDRVRRFQAVARSGNVGFSTGPHLHFHAAVSIDNALNAQGEFLFKGRQADSEHGKYKDKVCADPEESKWWKPSGIKINP